MLEFEKMDNPAEKEYVKKCVVIADKNHFTSSRNNTRKCDEVREKISFKDVYNDTFSQSIDKRLDLQQLKEAPMATQLNTSSKILKSEEQLNTDLQIHNLSCANVNNAAEQTLKEDKFYHLKQSCDPRLGKKKHIIMDYKEKKERLKKKVLVATKMLNSLKYFHHHQILFLAIFFLMCFGTNGAHKDVSLLGKKLQIADVQHPSLLMRSKRDSRIDREGSQSQVYNSGSPCPYSHPRFEGHDGNDQHGDVCRKFFNSAWTCPTECVESPDGAPWCIMSDNDSSPCRASGIFFGVNDAEVYNDDDVEYFPTPVVENVKKSWKPVSYGHPLQDATMFYAPPSLERVVIKSGGVNIANDIDRSDRGPQSRSLNGEQRSHFDGNPNPPPKPNVVIAAEPRKNFGAKGYSVYGSPDINYSSLYGRPPVKLQTHETPMPNGREDPYLIFQRDYFNSAKGSRAADDGKFEQQLLLSPQLAELARKDPRFADRKRPIGPRVDLGGPGGGGIRYMDPPNRKTNDYVYYHKDSPRYNKNANLLKSPNKDEKTVKHPYAFDKGSVQNPKGVSIQIGEHRGNAGGIDRTEITFNTPQKGHNKTKITNEIDIITAEDLVGRESVKSYSKPQNKQAKESSLINVYSFKNKHGQKEKVGIIYDQSSLSSPQINNIFDSQRNQIDHSGGVQTARNVYQSIPLNSNDRSSYQPPSQNTISSGSRATVQSIPLKRRPVSAARKIYPLGNPRNPSVKSRPEFFKPQPRPPIYKIRPHKLEGVFGPALPPKPEPTRIRLPNDYSTDYRDQQHLSVTPTPQQFKEIYGRRAYEEDIDYLNRPPFKQSYRTTYQETPHWHKVRRGDFGITDRQDVITRDVVYKSVRDMDYSRPQVILHVKDSGELYLPDPESLSKPYYDKSPRVEVTPGHGTLKQYLARKRKEEEENKRREKLRREKQEKLAVERRREFEQRRRAEEESARYAAWPTPPSTTEPITTISPEAWLADFSDSMPEGMKDKTVTNHNNNLPPKRSTANQSNINVTRDDLYRFQPLDLETEPSEQVVFRDTDIHRSLSPSSKASSFNGFKFPNNPQQQQNRPSLVREFRDVSKSAARLDQTRQTNSSPSTTNKNNIPHVIKKVRRRQPNIAEKENDKSNSPNYNVVIGLPYDDNEPDGHEKDYDFADDTNRVVKPTKPDTEYSQSELYQICIFEVPEYLKNQLCGGILEGRSQQFINRRSDFDSTLAKSNKNNKKQQITGAAVASVVIPPRPSNLLRAQENIQPISYNTVNTPTANSPRNDLPVAYNTNNKARLDKQQIKSLFVDKLLTSLKRNQNHPAPAVITANSKVKIYSPIQPPSVQYSVFSTPKLDLKETETSKPPTIATTETTTTIETPWKVIPVSTAPPVRSSGTDGSHNPSWPSTNNRRRQPDSPNFRKRPVTVIPEGYPRRRPLLYRKRNRHTGEVQASKPFEYFSKLAQHLGGRLPARPLQHRRRSTTTPPTLIRKRIRNDTK